MRGEEKIKKVIVCRGVSCGRKNRKMWETLSEREDIILEEVRCFGQCKKGPNVKIDGQMYHFMDLEKVEWFLKK
ncbi:hypothetical protein A2U10_02830 [Fusobacterium necrophorum subsp. funduliforme]|uniref:Uncharacterized protein n=3 Tax=Fusobacterium necrophorum TaxID=859 RepID=A0A170MUI7_9FUSO|nr:(2Fe-2S) ferredoxin domain-containing protein [Fusobacterium necrophorum]AZW10134.1 (2Fe-2S) ferredoxin domain-containing protein [Fusobacterium necrophorum subsp. necrophorum]AYV93480.1 (2Fe-2S) ferredoxin domain-containing protein [Fusobacterium necrophorum subsp. funduliforme]AYV95604.1 (2Fe-2S) ferredoxin domain-containing protein [Fusobacterium necrophorum subsp. funduliforme]AYZ73987.1 (2Fe-2S) ferredoxin domain-containing protein [Fusobacterium necrophorum]EIJ67061.1 respiratory-chai